MMSALPPRPAVPDDAELEKLLKRRTRFVRLVHVAVCGSTQQLAGEAIDPGDLIAWADHQTAGRGRQQRRWNDVPGADLALTLRVRERLPEPLLLPAALPVAVLQACEPFAGRRLGIKWPNDLQVDGRKLCGVLIDRDSRDPDTYLIGIGINVNRAHFPRELEPTATSLALVTGREVDRGALLLAVAERVDAMLHAIANGRTAELAALFAARLGLVGQRVRVEADDARTGTLTAIDLERLVLDGARAVPLAIVRRLQAAPPAGA